MTTPTRPQFDNTPCTPALTRAMPVKRIITEVAAAYSTDPAVITGQSKKKPATMQRRITMWLAREIGHNSQAIGEGIGRHYNSVSNGASEIDSLRHVDDELRRQTDTLLAYLEELATRKPELVA